MTKEERRRLEAQKKRRKAKAAKLGVLALLVLVAATLAYAVGMA